MKMDKNIPRSVKEGTRTQRSTNPGPNVHVLGLHQKMLQAGGWERFWSNGDNKNILIALFVKFQKSAESEEYRKYIVWYVTSHIPDYVRTVAYRTKA